MGHDVNKPHGAPGALCQQTLEHPLLTKFWLRLKSGSGMIGSDLASKHLRRSIQEWEDCEYVSQARVAWGQSRQKVARQRATWSPTGSAAAELFPRSPESWPPPSSPHRSARTGGTPDRDLSQCHPIPAIIRNVTSDDSQVTCNIWEVDGDTPPKPQ